MCEEAKWKVATALLTNQMKKESHFDVCSAQNSHLILPLVYIFYRTLSIPSAAIYDAYQKAVGSNRCLESVEYTQLRVARRSPMSCHIAYRLLSLAVSIEQLSEHTRTDLPYYKFLGDEFYASFKLCSTKTMSGVESRTVYSKDLLQKLHYWTFSHFIASSDMPKISNAVRIAFESNLHECPTAHDTLKYFGPKGIPSAFFNMQHDDMRIRLMRYICTYLSGHAGTEKNDAHFSKLLPRGLHADYIRTHSDSSKHPRMILCAGSRGEKMHGYGETLPLFGRLLNVFERSLKSYYALHKFYCPQRTINLAFDWEPLRSVALMIYRILLERYSSGSDTGYVLASLSHSSSWQMATHFLSNITRIHGNEISVREEEKSPVLCHSMYFSLLSMMWKTEHISGGDSFMKRPIIHRSIVLHMLSMLYQARRAPGAGSRRVPCSGLLDVYRNIFTITGDSSSDRHAVAINSTYSFANFILQYFRFRSMDLWAKSVYIFSTLESAAPEGGTEMQYGGLQCNTSVGARELYKFAMRYSDGQSGRNTFIRNMLYEFCTSTIILNPTAQGDQSPRGFFWMHDTFQQLWTHLKNERSGRTMAEIPRAHCMCQRWLSQRIRFNLEPMPVESNEAGPQWVRALKTLDDFCANEQENLTDKHSFLRYTINLVLFLCLGKLGLAGQKVQKIIEILQRKRQLTATHVQRFTSLPSIRQMEIPRSNSFFHTVSVHALTPSIIFLAATSNVSLIVQELVHATLLIASAMTDHKGSIHASFASSRDFWDKVFQGSPQNTYSILRVLHILLTAQRSLAKGPEVAQRRSHCREDDDSLLHAMKYFFEFARNFIDAIVEPSGFRLSSAQDVRNHLQKVCGKPFDVDVSQEEYLGMKTVDFDTTFAVVDTANIMQSTNLKIFIESIARERSSVDKRRLNVFIPCTFLYEFITVSFQKFKGTVKTSAVSHTQFFRHALDSLKDLTQLPCAHVMLLSPEAEYILRCPVSAIQVNSNSAPFSDNILVKCEIDHMLTATGLGLHRLLEKLRCTKNSSKPQCMHYNSQNEVLVVTQDKLSASVALANGVRCATMHYRISSTN